MCRDPRQSEQDNPALGVEHHKSDVEAIQFFPIHGVTYFFILLVVSLGLRDCFGRLENIQKGPRINVSFQSLGLIGASGRVYGAPRLVSLDRWMITRPNPKMKPKFPSIPDKMMRANRMSRIEPLIV
ncbi:hypothetical protein D3C81_1340480 [compost metagenome]